eukprot:1179623-Prorocentrum_minimum.AAC.1
MATEPHSDVVTNGVRVAVQAFQHLFFDSLRPNIAPAISPFGANPNHQTQANWKFLALPQATTGSHTRYELSRSRLIQCIPPLTPSFLPHNDDKLGTPTYDAVPMVILAGQNNKRKR